MEVSSIQKPSCTERPQMARLIAAVCRVSETVACRLFVVDQRSVHFSDVKVTEKTQKHRSRGLSLRDSDSVLLG